MKDASSPQLVLLIDPAFSSPKHSWFRVLVLVLVLDVICLWCGVVLGGGGFHVIYNMAQTRAEMKGMRVTYCRVEEEVDQGSWYEGRAPEVVFESAATTSTVV